MSEEPIENRTIPGVTVKNLIGFFCGVISVITSIMVSTFSIKSDIKDSNTKIEKVAEQVQELKQSATTRDTEIKTIQLQIQTIQLQVARIEEQLNYKKTP